MRPIIHCLYHNFDFLASISSFLQSSLRAIIEIISDEDFNYGSSWFREAFVAPLKDVMCTSTIPIPALLTVIFLWAAKLSQFPELGNVEDSYYRLTKEVLQESLIDKDGMSVSYIIHYIFPRFELYTISGRD